MSVSFSGRQTCQHVRVFLGPAHRPQGRSARWGSRSDTCHARQWRYRTSVTRITAAVDPEKNGKKWRMKPHIWSYMGNIRGVTFVYSDFLNWPSYTSNGLTRVPNQFLSGMILQVVEGRKHQSSVPSDVVGGKTMVKKGGQWWNNYGRMCFDQTNFSKRHCGKK